MRGGPRKCRSLAIYMAPMPLGYAAWLVQGLVTGVATNIPAGEVNSDDNVGYGMAYPILSVKDVILSIL